MTLLQFANGLIVGVVLVGGLAVLGPWFALGVAIAVVILGAVLVTGSGLFRKRFTVTTARPMFSPDDVGKPFRTSSIPGPAVIVRVDSATQATVRSVRR